MLFLLKEIYELIIKVINVIMRYYEMLGEKIKRIVREKIFVICIKRKGIIFKIFK